MKIKSVSGITCYVKDLQKTATFYETLGFETRKKDENHVTFYSNWFWIDCVLAGAEGKKEFQKDGKAEDKGAGIYVYLSVDDVDEFYTYLVGKGFKPSSEPRDWPWGNREFVIRDPDGYKLVIFKRK